MSDPSTTLTIGQVAELSGIPATTLRYYEQRGLIDAPGRVGGQRRFRPSVLRRLMVIKFCRIAGLSLDDIAIVVADRSTDRRVTKQIAAEQLASIDQQLLELSLARRMMHAASNCTCATVDDCQCGSMSPVLAELQGQLSPMVDSPAAASPRPGRPS
jgi:DNA-binding transcriptional MerR regulator